MNTPVKLAIAILSVAASSFWLNMAYAVNHNADKPLRVDHLSSRPMLGRYVASSIIFGNDTREPIAAVCRPLVANFNQFRDVPFESDQPRFSPQYPQFRDIWKPMPWNQELAERIYVGCSSEDCVKRLRMGSAWQFWLNYTKPLRQAGETLLWSARVDLLGDGRYETLIRLTHFFGPDVIHGKPVPVPPSNPYSRYFDSLIYMLPSSDDPEMARIFNNGTGFGLAYVVTDVIQNDGNKNLPFLTLSWSRSSSGLGVTSFTVSSNLSSYTFDPLCNIRWIPRKK